jgi:uncharacterized protein
VLAGVIAVLACAVCLAPAAGATAAPATSTPRTSASQVATTAPTATRPDARVCVDEVGVLGSALCTKVAAILDEDERLTTDEIAVLVVRTSGDETIEHYATRTFNSWGIGQADKDNGVLLLVAMDDRAVRIEVGTGLESTLTDGEAEEIIYGTITPEFKSGDYRTGILAGLDAIRKNLEHRVTVRNALAGLAGNAGTRYTPRPTTSRQHNVDDSGDDGETSSSDGTPVLWIVLLVLLVGGSWAWSAYRRANGYDDGDDDASGGYRRSSYRSRGSRSFGSSGSRRSSGSSSRSSFGGGRSRGGGGSGSW